MTISTPRNHAALTAKGDRVSDEYLRFFVDLTAAANTIVAGLKALEANVSEKLQADERDNLFSRVFAARSEPAPASDDISARVFAPRVESNNFMAVNVISGGVVLPKASGIGVKVDPAAPSYPWHDLLGAISIRGVGATDPGYNVYRGGIRGYQFAVNDEVFIEFHIPHDYVPGSDIHLHFHWSINGKTKAGAAAGTVTGGTTTWGSEVSYSKGHNQAAFIAPITRTVVSATTASTLYQHYITETQLSAASPSASQLDSDDLEVDGVILCRAYLSANNITVSSGSVPAPFLHYVDVHYQSTGIGTKQKAPDFWT